MVSNPNKEEIEQLEPQLELVVVEKPKRHWDEIMIDYSNLSEKLDKTIQRINDRKARKAKN